MPLKLGRAKGRAFNRLRPIKIAIALTTLFALASWHLYEKQFLKLKKFFPLPSSGDAGLGRLQNVDYPRGGYRRGTGGGQLELEAVVTAGNEGQIQHN